MSTRVSIALAKSELKGFGAAMKIMPLVDWPLYFDSVPRIGEAIEAKGEKYFIVIRVLDVKHTKEIAGPQVTLIVKMEDYGELERGEGQRKEQPAARKRTKAGR